MSLERPVVSMPCPYYGCEGKVEVTLYFNKSRQTWYDSHCDAECTEGCTMREDAQSSVGYDAARDWNKQLTLQENR